jgi:hypothetical protein
MSPKCRSGRAEMLPCRLEQLSLHTRYFVATQIAQSLQLRPFMAYRLLLVAVLLLLAFADPSFANWWIVRAADNKCLVVDIEPPGNDKDITKVGKDVYQTREQAEADVKKVCKEEVPPRTPGNAE